MVKGLRRSCGQRAPFYLLYDETVNFGSKSWAHQGFGMLMGMLVGFRGRGQRSLDLKSVLFELFDQTEKQVIHFHPSRSFFLRNCPLQYESLMS